MGRVESVGNVNPEPVWHGIFGTLTQGVLR